MLLPGRSDCVNASLAELAHAAPSALVLIALSVATLPGGPRRGQAARDNAARQKWSSRAGPTIRAVSPRSSEAPAPNTPVCCTCAPGRCSPVASTARAWGTQTGKMHCYYFLQLLTDMLALGGERRARWQPSDSGV